MPIAIVLATVICLGLLHLVGLWNRGWCSPLAALLLGGLLTGLIVPQARRALRRWDWRTSAMLAAALMSIAATLVGFDLGWDQPDKPNAFWHDVFTNWVGSVVFFATIGLAVAVVPMTRPATDHFYIRALNLFRGADGEHIIFLIEQLRDVQANYAELVEETLTVRDFHPDTARFLVDTETQTTVRSAIDDVRTIYTSVVNMSDVADPPDASQPNRLTFVEVDGQTRQGREFMDGDINEPIKTEIKPGAACKVRFGMQYWVGAVDEENTYEPVRFTQRVRLTVRNQVNGARTLNIRINRAGAGFDPIRIPPGGSVLVYDASDLKPGKILYDYRLDSLT